MDYQSSDQIYLATLYEVAYMTCTNALHDACSIALVPLEFPAVQVIRIHVGDVVMFLRLAEAFRGTGKALQKNFDDGQTPALPVVLAICRSVSHAQSVLNSLKVQPINVAHCHLVVR